MYSHTFQTSNNSKIITNKDCEKKRIFESIDIYTTFNEKLKP